MQPTKLLSAFLGAVAALLFAPAVTFAQSTFTFTGTVTSNGTAVNAAKVFVTSDHSDGSAFFLQGTTDGSGNVSLNTQLPDLNEPFNLTVDVISVEGVSSVSFTPKSSNVSVAANANSANAQISVSLCNATISVNLTDTLGAARQVQAGESMSVGCQSSTGDSKVTSVSVGQSSGTVNAEPGATYECFLIADGIGSNRASVTVQAGSNSATLVLTATDREILVDVVDNASTPITSIDFQITVTGASTMDFVNYGYTRSGDGKIHISVPNTPLNVTYAAISSNDVINASNFIFLPTTQAVTPAASPSSSVTLTVPQKDATLTVTVKNASGAVLDGAEVSVSAQHGSAETFAPISQSATTDSNGQASFKMLSGRTAVVNVVTLNGDRDPDGNGKFNESEPAASSTVMVAGSNAVTMSQVTNDYELVVTATSTLGTLSRVNCSASNGEMVSPIITLNENDTFNLKASAFSPYEVFCDGVVGTTYVKGSASHTASSAGDGEVTVALTSEGTYDAADTTFASGGSECEVPLDSSNCGEFSLPAKAGDTGGLAISAGTAKSVKESADVDLMNAVSIVARKTSDGSKVESFTAEAEVVLCYNESQLPSGTTEADIGCAATTAGGTVVHDIDCTVDTVNNKVTIKTTHLSTFGINLNGSATSTPTLASPATFTVKAKAVKNSVNKKVTLKWAAVSSASGYRIATTRVNKGTTTTTTKDYASNKTSATVTLKKAGTYTFVIAAKDTSGNPGASRAGDKSVKIKAPKKKKK